MNRIKVWEQIDYFQSASFTQKYLQNCYKLLPDDLDSGKIGYENCYPFMYYLDHGKLYYFQAENAPLAIRPVLLFYGLVHLIKACLLTVDPHYPETTSVLAHGVTSRKKKKQHYQFINDEVKIQRNGLFTHFSKKMFHVEHLDAEKFIMKNLFLQLPELDDCFSFLHSTNMIPVSIKKDKYFLPVSILDSYHKTFESFKEFIRFKSTVPINGIEQNNDYIAFSSDHELSLPFRFHLEKEIYCIPKQNSQLGMQPELIIYYLILYNLSMIARYETEWWSELLKTTPTNDYPLIKRFLSISLDKSPFLVHQYLFNKR